MSDPVQPDLTVRRRESGAFLRSRRARLSPADVGLPAGVRRRTPGLRREEVAMLAGVSATWYSWLEQGRDVRPSADVLEALADALRLDAVERSHLRHLQDRSRPEPSPAEIAAIDPSMRRLLDGLTAQPAFMIGRRWDILAWNAAATAVLGDFGRLRGEAKNALHLMFADPDYRRLFVDWEAVARPALAMFRADCAHQLGDPDVQRLTASLTEQSVEFRTWWPEREVVRPAAGCKRIHHPIAGEMRFEFYTLAQPDDRNVKTVILTPMDAVSVGKLSALLA